MGWESPSHWVIIAIVVIALFGYKKLPDAARAIGRSLRTFKTELHGMSEDDKARDDRARDDRAREDATRAPKSSEADVTEAPAESEPVAQKQTTPAQQGGDEHPKA